jgi:hypothetical protein
MSSLGGTKKWALGCAFILSALAIAPACDKKVAEQPKGRKEPVCAFQDCATGKVLDDGCDQTGRCSSCINLCASAEPPSAAPSAR